MLATVGNKVGQSGKQNGNSRLGSSLYPLRGGALMNPSYQQLRLFAKGP
jgi:hypothetical protein